MPLCSECRSEAELHNTNAERVTDAPPYGMEWGQHCDRCLNIAGVVFE